MSLHKCTKAYTPTGLCAFPGSCTEKDVCIWAEIQGRSEELAAEVAAARKAIAEADDYEGPSSGPPCWSCQSIGRYHRRTCEWAAMKDCPENFYRPASSPDSDVLAEMTHDETTEEVAKLRQRAADIDVELDLRGAPRTVGKSPALAMPYLPTNSKERKETPVYSGCLAYFPLALAEIAKLSKAGNDKHNPGQPLHWSKDKSSDHADCVARHLLEIGTFDPDDGHRHSTKLAWRALANLQIELENAAAKKGA